MQRPRRKMGTPDAALSVMAASTFRDACVLPALPFGSNGRNLCAANLRGGGEYGEKWHLGGTKLRKQNVLMISSPRVNGSSRIITHSTPKLAINGRSNGGLLVGACLTQLPTYGVHVARCRRARHAPLSEIHIGWAGLLITARAKTRRNSKRSTNTRHCTM